MGKLNIFVLHEDPALAAQYACDMHVSKMVTETAQILSTIHRWYIQISPEEEELIRNQDNPEQATLNERIHKFKDSLGDKLGLYKLTHRNHPSVVWVGSSVDSYEWTYEYFVALAKEYEFRFGKQHLAFLKTNHILSSPPEGLLDIGNLGPPDSAPPLIVSPEILTEVSRTYARNPVNSEIIFRIPYPENSNVLTMDMLNINPRFLSWDLCVKYYRKYYFTDKRHIGRWTKRAVPHWFQEALEKEGYKPVVNQVKARVGTKQVIRDVHLMQRQE